MSNGKLLTASALLSVEQELHQLHHVLCFVVVLCDTQDDTYDTCQ